MKLPIVDISEEVARAERLSRESSPTAIAAHRNAHVAAVCDEVTATIFNNPSLSREQKRGILEQVKADFSTSSMIPSDGLIAELPKDILERLDGDNELTKEWGAELEGLSGSAKQRKFKEFRGRLHKKGRELAKASTNLRRAKDRAGRMKEAALEMNSWVREPLTLQRPDGSTFQKLRQAFVDDEAYCVSAIEMDPLDLLARFDRSWSAASVFVVEHNWSAAFEKATDFAAGEFKLPDDICVFEFRFSGRTVVVTAFMDDDRASDALLLMPAIRTKHGWIVNGFVGVFPSGRIAAWKGDDGPMTGESGTGSFTAIPADDPLIRLIRLMADQIRAVSIALDAEVAQSTVVRAEHRSNREPRAAVRLPSYSYHVVSLARRSRAERAPIDPTAEPTHRKRLHFRRGHWRHYQESKTWIRWCLVGDPDLGFVDKHYKL